MKPTQAVKPPAARHAALYDSLFYSELNVIGGRSANVVVPLLMELIQPRSVVDVGCGAGAWLSVFHEHGIDDYVGVDSPWVDLNSLVIPRDRFLQRNLELPISLSRKFDLVVCLEVAEHLHPRAAVSLVRSLTELGDVVMFSAAIPSQGGVYHVNEEWPEYWASLFATFGFVPVDCIRPRIWSDPGAEWWYAQNTILYVRADELPHLRLTAAVEAAGPQLTMVRRELYLKILGKYQEALVRSDLGQVPVRNLLRALPGALVRSLRRTLSRPFGPRGQARG